MEAPSGDIVTAKCFCGKPLKHRARHLGVDYKAQRVARIAAGEAAKSAPIPARDQSFALYIDHVGCGDCPSTFGGPFLLNSDETNAAYNASVERAQAHHKEIHGRKVRNNDAPDDRPAESRVDSVEPRPSE